MYVPTRKCGIRTIPATSSPWSSTDIPKVNQTSLGFGPGASSRPTATAMPQLLPGPTGSVTMPTRSTPAFLMTSITFITVP